MSSATRKPATRPGSAAKRTAQRRPRPASATARPASAASRRWWWPMVIAGAAVLVAGGIYLAAQNGDAGGTDSARPYVGGDLHTITAIDSRLYVGGHDGVAVSTDEGQTWTPVPSLQGADAMGWAQTSSGLLVGGHPGLFTSTDDGTTFAKATGDSQVGDVHALGAAGNTVYLASPQAGLLTSDDGGSTWTRRNSTLSQTFMGNILVDPSDPQHVIAPDMQNGLVASSDGGDTWTVLGGPAGAMSVGWDPTDTQRLIAVGMDGGAISDDGGRTWTDLQLPDATSAATFSADGTTLYAAGLDGDTARVSASTDNGKTWNEL